MAVIVEPNIPVEDVEIKADEQQDYNVNRMINEWGHAVPLVKINEYTCGIGDVVSCHIYLTLGNLPKFEICVRDDNYDIREALKQEIDTCIIFFGYKDWYIKFKGIIQTVNSDSGEIDLYLEGIFYNQELYNSKQILYSETSVVDILTDICTQTKMGLFTFDNTDLNFVPDIVINPNKTHLDFVKELVERYTNNIFCFDTFGYLHIGDVESMRSQPVDKMTISPKDGSTIPETEICFLSRKLESKEEENYDKIPIQHYTICNNFSLTKLYTSTNYSVLFDNNESLELPSNEEIGFSIKTENTFSGFAKHKFPFYDERINKMLNGCLIKINVRQVVYELTPFSIVNLELYLPASSMSTKEEGADQVYLDEEHSGKRIVIGYSFDYDKNTSDNSQNHIEQNIYLI